MNSSTSKESLFSHEGARQELFNFLLGVSTTVEFSVPETWSNSLKSWVMPRWRTIDLCKWKFLLFSVFNLYPDNYQIRCSTCRSAPLQCRRTPPLSNIHLLELIPPLNSNPATHMSTSLPSLSQAATLIPDGYVTWLVKFVHDGSSS